MIEAKVIADTVSKTRKRITTLQLVYPRFIHSEVLTHRQMSRNSSSSRAVPVAKMVAQVRNTPALPVHWGANRPGMQAAGELDDAGKFKALEAWLLAAKQAADTAEYLMDLGLHKQVANRVLEPFQFMHTVVTATEWDNFFTLRLAEDAQPEIQALAKAMKAAMDGSQPVQSERHLPYIREQEIQDWLQTNGADESGIYKYFAPISAARCARVSYLNHDGSTPDIEKDLVLAEKLLTSAHMSPFEHQASALDTRFQPSGNFYGWKQYRKEIEA